MSKARPVGAQQHHRPGAPAGPQLAPGQRQDTEDRGEALRPGQRGRLQRLRGPRASGSRQGVGGDYRRRSQGELALPKSCPVLHRIEKSSI